MPRLTRPEKEVVRRALIKYQTHCWNGVSNYEMDMDEAEEKLIVRLIEKFDDELGFST